MKEHVLKLIERHHGCLKMVAKSLRIEYSTFYLLLKRMGISSQLVKEIKKAHRMRFRLGKRPEETE